ncbi:glutathione S-transferase C-terminal domain-containing protein [Malaclemys terrapin pileata]|uniref:glutathione S-transferase C-terminal domain-containing protein n=1 Tax=Malaclemys terrapin pileata TaxID=2991368 RepID=UPI0023A80A63|nr:glutathione S-transferase C-terminal domain-containing protein [Malaclemys terrapin pileata]XP_053885433.1 glutathione S-transferase C-terminal domain-containing protein [Malaclemys terrapin pileata]XP_053885436.1 glutathione S-transferase C-terminal domain-containing protein [Malaclemys terrapin pileata]XP_053885437.1 glutathione S-transferase C-terminal domain-containing protein [Malaclemys terrapin pileata]XP_053885438.1 glutathione S-transferase C-terminal domain-containing protein [Mala
MKGGVTEEHLYLAYSHQFEDCIFPLHTSISLFLLSYCDCKLFKVFLVPASDSTDDQLFGKAQPDDLEVHFISRCQLPLVVQSCCLPAIVEENGKFCRAGLSVVLRHIIQKTYEVDPSKKLVLELLGFKKTCLKACAEVSQWTRLCEISIPQAVESLLNASPDQCQAIPPEVLLLEKKLGEPVRVHNDDKIRRQKLQQQKAGDKTAAPALAKRATKNLSPEEGTIVEIKDQEESASLELKVAFSKLVVQEIPATTNREPSHIRKTKTSDLPPLEHVFAEGLYFTLADVVLLPCIHQFLVFIKKHNKKLLDLPLISSWYNRVQEVLGVKSAAAKCNMLFLQFPDLPSFPDEQLRDFYTIPDDLEEEHEDYQFIGGPRPTMTKLMESGIEAKFSPHPCPRWTLDWNSLPAAVSPGEGKMSSDRALRKQQQLNNLVSMVTKLSKPGDVVVDFCSGGGHVGIVLAHMLPSCQVVLIENKELSLVRAKDRSDELGLQNIWFVQANLDYFKGTFNIGVALHACGVATDMVIEHCIKAHAAFVICPCCYGFIQNTVKFTFPRSHRFKEVLSYKEHMILCRFADQTAVQLPPERRLIGKHCMGLVDLDRAWAAEGCNYSVQVMSMEPESCSPKNNMVVGVPI